MLKRTDVIAGARMLTNNSAAPREPLLTERVSRILQEYQSMMERTSNLCSDICEQFNKVHKDVLEYIPWKEDELEVEGKLVKAEKKYRHFCTICSCFSPRKKVPTVSEDLNLEDFQKQRQDFDKLKRKIEEAFVSAFETMLKRTKKAFQDNKLKVFGIGADSQYKISRIQYSGAEMHGA